MLGSAKKRLAYWRHGCFYMELLRKANRLYEAGGASVSRALSLYDDNIENIFSGQRWASSNYQGDEEISQLCCDYGLAGFHVLNMRLSAARTIKWYSVALTASREIDDQLAELQLLGNLAVALKNSGANERSFELSHDQLLLAKRCGDVRAQRNAFNNMGLVQKNLENYDIAMEYLEKARQLSLDLGDKRYIAVATGNLGIPYLKKKMWDIAITRFETALALARECGDRRGEGADLCNLGLAWAGKGDSDRAIQYFGEHLIIARQIGDYVGEANSLYNIAEEHWKKGEIGAAIECAENSLRIREYNSDWRVAKTQQAISEWRAVL